MPPVLAIWLVRFAIGWLCGCMTFAPPLLDQFFIQLLDMIPVHYPSRRSSNTERTELLLWLSSSGKKGCQTEYSNALPHTLNPGLREH
jgi:hypothetical protein